MRLLLFVMNDQKKFLRPKPNFENFLFSAEKKKESENIQKIIHQYLTSINIENYLWNILIGSKRLCDNFNS